ncbi:MAG TPA: hypothetical protein VHT91_44705 [Kofleriaceae bacterium]|jgi:hypothetical protein|nr:hypothetical protein [Kofleriaceae bacterium]
MSNPPTRIVSAALALAAASACGAGNSQPPLPLSESNAAEVAAEALIATDQSSFTVQLPTGVLSGVAAAGHHLDRDAVQRLAALAAGPPGADGTTTSACSAGGSATVTIAGSTVTYAFRDCADGVTRLDGTLRFTVQQSSPNQASLSASLDLTVAVGALTFNESGGYTVTVKTAQNPSDSTDYELHGDSLSVSLSAGGALRDDITLSHFDIGISMQLTSTDHQVEHFSYDIDSSRLEGHISVMTTQDLEQVIDLVMPREHPFAGQILISGASHTRLQITILGDERFTPPAGQGQIELQIDPGTGTFGAPIWTSWAELSAMVSIAP